MRIQLNGAEREVGEARTVEALLEALAAELRISGAGLLVEHNGLALRRTEWRERFLAEGDQVEVIRIVAGG